MRRDDDVEVALGLVGVLDREERAEQRDVAEQRDLALVGDAALFGEAADDERLAVMHGGGGRRLALADRRITLREAGDARHHREDVRRHEPVVADPGRDL